MGREKKSVAVAGTKNRVRRHNRQARPLPPGLVAKPSLPAITSKHKTFFELVDNENKKKKLEVQVTTSRQPPLGFAFVPIGNPEITKMCKEISREQGAKVFIVSVAKHPRPRGLALHLNRIGHHIRESIVREAQEMAKFDEKAVTALPDGALEPIPKSQAEINVQADAAIRDLFPRIPNTDRQMIIDYAFRKGATFKGEPLVGLQPDLSLSRRVQLAVLAHIRHTHTRYDQLLRETSYLNARRAVEPLCLDILVKWRGDEENGRDDLDVILKEVVVIDDDDDDDESSEESSGKDDAADNATTTDREDATPVIPGLDTLALGGEGQRSVVDTPRAHEAQAGQAVAVPKPGRNGISKRRRVQTKKLQKGFRRYKAAWDQAVDRWRQEELVSSPVTVENPGPGRGGLPSSSCSREPLGRSVSYETYETQSEARVHRPAPDPNPNGRPVRSERRPPPPWEWQQTGRGVHGAAVPSTSASSYAPGPGFSSLVQSQAPPAALSYQPGFPVPARDEFHHPRAHPLALLSHHHSQDFPLPSIEMSSSDAGREWRRGPSVEDRSIIPPPPEQFMGYPSPHRLRQPPPHHLPHHPPHPSHRIPEPPAYYFQQHAPAPARTFADEFRPPYPPPPPRANYEEPRSRPNPTYAARTPPSPAAHPPPQYTAYDGRASSGLPHTQKPRVDLQRFGDEHHPILIMESPDRRGAMLPPVESRPVQSMDGMRGRLDRQVPPRNAIDSSGRHSAMVSVREPNPFQPLGPHRAPRSPPSRNDAPGAPGARWVPASGVPKTWPVHPRTASSTLNVVNPFHGAPDNVRPAPAALASQETVYHTSAPVPMTYERIRPAEYPQERPLLSNLHPQLSTDHSQSQHLRQKRLQDEELRRHGVIVLD